MTTSSRTTTRAATAFLSTLPHMLVWQHSSVVDSRCCVCRIADKHVKTLVKCIAHYAADPHIQLFRRFLNKEYDNEDLQFFLTVVLLSREGIPTRFAQYVVARDKLVLLPLFTRWVCNPTHNPTHSTVAGGGSMVDDEAFMRSETMPSRRSSRARKSSRRFSRHRLSRPSSRHMSSRLSSRDSPRHAARAAPGRASNGRIAARLMSLPRTTSEGPFSENDSRHAVQEQGITASGRWLKAASSSKSMLRATSSMRRSIPVKQMTAARLIPRSAAHGGDNGVPRGLPLPDWFWASVTASTLAHATGEPVNITAPDGTAAGYRELIQATSRASYLRLAQQYVLCRSDGSASAKAVALGGGVVTIACALASCRFGGNAEQIRQVLTTPMTSDDMQQVMVTQVRPHKK